MTNRVDLLRSRGILHDITDESGVAKLKAGTPFYVGFDPSGPSLHFGNLLQIVTAVRLAESGLKPIMLFGGATGAVGDPSGKSNERSLLSRDEINANVARHQRRVRAILERRKIDAVYVNNLDWAGELTLLEFLRDFGKHFPVNYMLAKDFVKERLEHGGFSYTEFSYILLQSYDFLHLFQEYGCRLQFGGSDQWGNITGGLELIRRKLQQEVFALSTQLILDTQGRKFGKSEHGAIWIDGEMLSPYEFHQYLLNVSDADVIRLLKTFTFLDLDAIQELEQLTKSAPQERKAQRALADALTAFVHGDQAVSEANRGGGAMFGGSLESLDASELLKLFGSIPSSEIKRDDFHQLSALDLLVRFKLVKSKGDGRRLIDGGGAYINNIRITDSNLALNDPKITEKGVIIVRTGKKNYHLVKVR